MTIAAAEDWLLAVIRDEMGSAVNVDTGPYDWSGEYLKKLIRDLPAVRVVWDGGTAADATSVSLAVTWTLYVVTGWQGENQEARRRAASNGAYVMLAALTNRLHNLNMADAQFSASGTRVTEAVEGAGRLRLSEIVNEGGSEWDRVGIAIYSIVLDHQMPLEFEAAAGTVDDWLGGDVDFDRPGTVPDPDLEGTYTIPQT